MAKSSPFVADPRGTFDVLRERLAETVKGVFPIVGRRNTLELEDLHYAQDPDLRDVRAQLDARLNDRTWGVPLVGRFALRDSVTGKVKSRGELPLATVPAVTAARGYIVDGREYYADHLWKGRPGVFTYPKARTVVSSIVTPERSLNIEFDPKAREFKLRTGGSTVPLKPVLQAMGISNTALAKAWGDEIARANDTTERRAQTALSKLGRALGRPPDPLQIRDALSSLPMDPETTKYTMGRSYRQVSPELLLHATKRALAVARGKSEPDDRDSLRFKNLVGIDDHLAYAVRKFGQHKARSLRSAVDRHDRVEQALRPNLFHWPIRGFFVGSPLSQVGEQTNPVDMMRASMRSTILGEAGSAHALEHSEAKAVNPSHVGFIDPLDTPEGQNVGINLQLAIGLMKDHNTPRTLLYNPRTAKYEEIDPATFESSIIAFPDQYRRDGKKWTPISRNVRASGPGNKFVRVEPDKVDYIVPSPGLLFGVGSSLVPFMQNTNAGRVEMASRHLSQAIPLAAREAPLVQVAVDEKAKESVEEVLARETLPLAPAAGKVLSVQDDVIRLRTTDGKTHSIQLYKNYPLTGKRELVDEMALVKPGQMVRKGQPLADSIFTDKGVLALGTNLRSVSGDTPIFWIQEGKAVRRRIREVNTSGPAETFTCGQEPGSSRQAVRRYIAHETDERMIEVETWTGRRFRVTECHSLVTMGDDGLLVEIRPTDVVPGRTFLPRLGRLPLPETIDRIVLDDGTEFLLDEEFGWLVGLYLAEGWILGVCKSRNKPSGLGLAVTDPALKARLASISQKLLKHTLTWRDRSVHLFSASLGRFFGESFGHGSWRKHLPGFVWSSPTEFRRGLIAGYWDGDGTVTLESRYSGDVSAYSTSEELRDQVAEVCLSLEIDTTLVHYPGCKAKGPVNKFGFRGDTKPLFGVRVANRCLPSFPDVHHSVKRSRLIALRGKPIRWTSSNMIPIPKGLLPAFKALLQENYGRLPKKRAHLYTRGYVDRDDLLEELESCRSEGVLLDRLRAWAEADIYWDRVKSTRIVDRESWVFDLEMSDSPHFAVSNGIIVHNTALISMPGLTYEDGIAVSESAARKLLSEHLHKIDTVPDEQEVVDPKRFQAYYPTAFTRDQFKQIDRSGVVKPGSVVKPGDPLVLGLRPIEHTNEALAMKRMHRSLAKPYRNAAVTWDQDVAGEVIRAHKTPSGAIKVHVRTQEPLQVADKLTTRNGVKGVVTAIIPDDRMPRTKDGPIELALNPHGIAARVTVGQIYELATGKMAKKIGRPIKVPNFLPDSDYGETTRAALGKLGIDEEDEVTDPVTGRVLGKAAVGYAYILKQRHQVDRKMAARAGGPGFTYDVNRQPKGGGAGAGQRIGGLGNMALLAHGAREILRESKTFKSDADQADEMWRAVQLGQPLPPPKLTFAHRKFEEYLKGLGVRLDKDGTRVKMIPVTDQEILDAGHGELSRPGLMLRASDLKPEKGGLFDPQVTGGLQGEYASHIRLAEPFPNPFFERGVLALTGLKQKDLHDVIAGRIALDPGGAPVDRKVPGARTGGNAVEGVLKAVDVDREITALKNRIPQLEGQALDAAARKYRYLSALKQAGLSPDAAYMTRHVYVLPPSMRPLSVLPSGALVRDSLNELYKGVGIVNERLGDMDPDTPDLRKGRTRFALYQALGSLAGMMDPVKTTQGVAQRGIIDVVAGVGSPKWGWVQDKLLKAKQDMAARSVVVPDPDLTIDELGIPLPIAKTIFRPFVVRELTRMGHGALQAQEMLKKDDPLALRALDNVMIDRPVLMKRDPVLHKYGIQAFKARIVGGREIRTPPLITESLGMDYDGDTTSLYVPVSEAAVEEARRMYPSENLLNPATGKPAFTPKNEMAVGLYRLSQFGKESGRSFSSPQEAAKEVGAGKLGMTDVVSVGGQKTTAGRLLVWQSLPPAARANDLLFNSDFELTKTNTEKLLADVALKDRKSYAQAAQALMNLGNAAVYDEMFSLSSQDVKTDKKLRDRHMKEGERKAREALASNAPDREEKAIQAWSEAGRRMLDEHARNARAQGNRLFQMASSGVKPTLTQFQEMTLAPVLMTDTKGNPILEPVTKSYGEGLDTAGYWLSAIGARTGLVQTATAVRDPGYINKQMINTIGTSLVVSNDLPDQGILLETDHPDVVDRYLVEPVKTAKFTLPKGTLLSSELIDRLRNARVRKVIVASPLTSPHGEGISSKSYGLAPDGQLPQIGENLGVMAGQSVGERLAQLMLASKHGAGVFRKGQAVRAGGSAMVRIRQLLRIPEEIPDPATLATTDGKISRIRDDPAGGWNVTVTSGRGSDVDHYVPGARKLLPGATVGSATRKGKPISDGNIDLRELLDIGGIDQVRNQMVSELDGIFRPFGIRRRNLELITRGVTNTGIITDPGDASDLVKGQYLTLSRADELNRTELKGRKPVRMLPVLAGIQKAPLANTEDWLAKMNHERVRDTLIEAALQGHVSDISGYNPFSAMAMNERFGQGISGKPGAY